MPHNVGIGLKLLTFSTVFLRIYVQTPTSFPRCTGAMNKQNNQTKISTHENVAELAHATFTVGVRLRENAACEALGTESATDGDFIAAGRWRGLNALSSSPDNSHLRCSSASSISMPSYSQSYLYFICPSYLIKPNAKDFLHDLLQLQYLYQITHQQIETTKLYVINVLQMT